MSLLLTSHYKSGALTSHWGFLVGVPEAICMKAYGPYSKLRESYLELFAEIANLGYEIADSPRACYVDGIWNQEDPEKWLTIIQVPVKKTQKS